MSIVLTCIGGFLVGWNATELWQKGYSRERALFASFGLLLATYGVLR